MATEATAWLFSPLVLQLEAVRMAFVAVEVGGESGGLSGGKVSDGRACGSLSRKGGKNEQ